MYIKRFSMIDNTTWIGDKTFSSKKKRNAAKRKWESVGGKSGNFNNPQPAPTPEVTVEAPKQNLPVKAETPKPAQSNLPVKAEAPKQNLPAKVEAPKPANNLPAVVEKKTTGKVVANAKKAKEMLPTTGVKKGGKIGKIIGGAALGAGLIGTGIYVGSKNKKK